MKFFLLSHRKTILQYLFLFGLAYALLRNVVKGVDLNALWIEIKNANPVYLILIAVVGVISIVSRAIRWQILIEPIEKRPGFWNTFFSIFIGYGVNFVTPRFGEVVRCGILAKQEEISADKLAGTMIAERLFDLICLLIVCIITFTLSFTTLTNYIQPQLVLLQEKLGFKFFLILGAVLLLGILFFMWLNRLLKTKDNKFSKIITNVKTGVLSVFKLKRSKEFFLHTCLIWICYLGMTYLGFKALTATHLLDIKAAFNVLTLGSFGFILTPGGTGAYQAVVKKVLMDLHEIPVLSAIAYGMISWALQNGILVVGALIGFFRISFVSRKDSKKDV
jgi:glycosyltransferase 2 family protein